MRYVFQHGDTAKSRDENAKPDCTATVLWRFWSQEFGEPKESNGDHGEGDQAWMGVGEFRTGAAGDCPGPNALWETPGTPYDSLMIP